MVGHRIPPAGRQVAYPLKFWRTPLMKNTSLTSPAHLRTLHTLPTFRIAARGTT